VIIEQNARELVFKESLENFCELLSQNQIRFLIFKGSALAYDFYKNPALRPRTDSDVLISESDVKRVHNLLMASGYEWIPNQMELLGQTVFTKKIGSLQMIYDVHWQVFAPRPLRHLFLFEELWAARKKISQLDAFTVSDQQALLLSSVHWVAHHLLYPEPYWIEDLQKITEGRDSAWWQDIQKISKTKGIQKIMDQTLRASNIQSPWDAQSLNSEDEPLAYLLKEKRSAWSDLRNDIKTMSYQEIFQFFGKHLFPSAVYMRSKYQLKRDVFLPGYYLLRLLTGFKKFLQPW
jgi:Uncharacterised nucleotidyltransferase